MGIGKQHLPASLPHMTYDVNKIRSHFPSLNTGLAFFCGPGGSQVPDVVGAAIAAAIFLSFLCQIMPSHFSCLIYFCNLSLTHP